jgi:PPM family protein phosphatase
MKIQAYGITDKGDMRERNEDAYGIFNEEKFYVLADGVGGHQGGEFAAKETVNHLYYNLQKVHSRLESCSDDEIQNFLKISISETNQTIINKGRRREELNGMASTFCLLFFYTNFAYYSHFGDSRIYLLRDKELKALTKDHTLAQELEDANQRITHERQKSTLTKAIGLDLPETALIDKQEYFLNDQFLLCSDGVMEGLSAEEIHFYLSQNKESKTILEEMIVGARNRGSRDNITAILVKVV